MPEIRPFRGLLYDATLVGDLSLVTAPPYDVVSPADREGYYRRSRYNVIRLILGKDLPGDSGRENKYTRARAFMDEWQRRGALVRDEEPAIYIYEHEYTLKNGEPHKTLGFLALVKIEPFGGDILPHEKTLDSPKVERLELLRATEANLCPVYMLYRDEKNVTLPLLQKNAEDRPALNVLDEDGVTHRVWRIQDEKTIAKLSRAVRKGRFYIADGHHRYGAALGYRDEVGSVEDNSDAPSDYIMAFLSDMDNQELTILPTHRVLKNLPKLNRQRLIENIGHFFEVEELRSLEELQDKMSVVTDKVIGAYLGDSYYYLLSLKEETLPDFGAIGLDVNLLHTVIIRKVLGLAGTNIENSINYTIDQEGAVSSVKSGNYSLAFFLKSTPLSAIIAIAEGTDTMPQKSTYFYPKPLTGLIINKLDW